MPRLPNALWLNVSPSFQAFDRPLLHDLSQSVSLAQWEYSQTVDEPASLEVALGLLHDYLGKRRLGSASEPFKVHLLGHSTGGLLGLLYARRYPERVRSLTLLAVGVHPAVNWQAHYYTLLQLLLGDRQMLLNQMVHSLFGHPAKPVVPNLVETLKQDLEQALSPHSLFDRGSIPSGGVDVPLCVCGSRDDVIVDPKELDGWKPFLKLGDRIWQCPGGRHFFHYFYPELVSEQVLDFWSSLEEASSQPCNGKSSLTHNLLDQPFLNQLFRRDFMEFRLC